MQKRIILSGLLTLFTGVLAANVAGRVVDTNGAVMPFVTISLLDADSALITGTITNDNGFFVVEKAPKASILRASYLGYQTQCLNLTDSTDSLIIRLEEQTNKLAEVVVMQKARLVERRMDKIVMNVASSPFAIGNNGKDILKKAPGVHIDRKGKITVNGKGVEVYVDGRPTYLSGEQLKAMLEGTDGSTIDRLEIITQPSAKYDAAGQGGIINIKTKRNRTKGLNGSLSAGYGGMYWRDIQEYMQDDHVSFNLNYRGAMTYTSASLTQQYSDHTETCLSSLITPENSRVSQMRTRYKRQYYLLKVSNDFMLDTVNTLGFIFSVPLSVNTGRGDKAHNYSELRTATDVLEQNTEDLRTNNKWLQHTANVNYTHVFSSALDRELTINIDYNRNNSLATTASEAEYYPASKPAYTRVVRQNSHHLTNIYSARADFQTNFWKTGKIECGAKWLTTQTGYNSLTDTVSSGASRSDFRYLEHIAALYATMGKQFGEHWTTKLGLRGEYTHATGTWVTADSVTSKSYFNLFPTAFVSYMPTPDWSISLDYTRRIDRPHYTMLDPSIQYEDGHSLRTGNTDLMPAFTHNVLLSFGYSEYVSLDFNFSHTRDVIDYRTTVLPGGNRLAKTSNFGTNTAHGIFLSLTEIPLIPKFGSTPVEGKRRNIIGAWLSLTAQIGANHEIIKAYDRSINLKHWSVDIYAELNAYLPKEWTVSVDGFYSGPSVWGTEKLSSWSEMNLAVKKDFPQHGLTLTARVNDLLLSSRWSSETLGLPDGYCGTFAGYDRMHAVSLAVSYKFGTNFEHKKHAELEDSRLAEPVGRKRRK